MSTSAQQPPSSLALWAASKIIGRECATINKEFFLCKKERGENPTSCEAESVRVSLCTMQQITALNESFPKEFTAFQVCLDKNDYRMNDCRKAEKALLDCYNNKHGLVKTS